MTIMNYGIKVYEILYKGTIKIDGKKDYFNICKEYFLKG